MLCTICPRQDRIEIVIDYLAVGSLRKTAKRFKIGYRSLHRHISKCLPQGYRDMRRLDFMSHSSQIHDVSPPRSATSGQTVHSFKNSRSVT